MCGIAGIIGENATEAELQIMLKKQAHRGPDHTGSYFDKGFAAIGHNRLSIIDLSAAANEPFQDNSGRYYLTFNGEIYNYKELKEELKDFYDFRTASDTEVLLASFLKWGKECLHKFRGMFAFGIWDSEKKELFAARDRFGVKPFYYTREEKSFYFSSEIKALQHLRGRDQPNEKVWANYFSYGSYGMPDETFFQQINQLPGGHLLHFSAGELQIEKWYDFEAEVGRIPADYSFEEAKEVYFDLLKESISLRFRADVPVGFNISGGVDSSLLLALVNQFEDKKNINAYTFYTGDERYDELPWVEQMIANTGNPLTKVKFSAEEAKSKASVLSKSQDEPFGGIPTLAYSKIFEQAQKDGIKVLLDGQGMDEQWAGYDYYFQQQSIEQNIQGVGNNSPFRRNALSPSFAAQAEKPEYPQPFDNPLKNMQYRDLFYTKIPRALRFNDRISMAYGVELREPFLDHKLVEFAFAMPADFKINNGIGKYMLRELLKPLVPAEISYAPKRRLQTPQREWLANELSGFTEEQLHNLKNSPVANWFDFEEIEKEWERYKEGDNESSFHIWQWVNASLVVSH
ncbi:asparagine synthase (glutamine-hydrolyzing) [Antarcticibacterium flavum]|uniref:asparagine synthase (glutamine-hydrolyzing) n=1 Tax=Antarcticibacterium flavum TaxID=2058175 RepID=A0A5B7X7E3_9FLAO|nr:MULTISPECIES: asparagine synthase (glutamine-hydrolyzing) [Antarcticibacterium]MCM4161750.1 asparagine synthase (glutamine-hydrolyzing) [Antarcticibacterium sp. W02-3]QCY70541.1 asparagine synthase (glutamine-hydrolyzing) [Antarcticibacterium flavum]